MDRKRLTIFTIAFGILILAVVLIFASGTVRRSGHIELPSADTGSAGDQQGEDGDAAGLAVVDIRPDTVQLAIEVMERPAMYTCYARVETFWSGGSGTVGSTVYVRDHLMRLDTQLAVGSVRHLIAGSQYTYIWYDDEEAYVTLETGDFSQDAELRIPTYEDILRLEQDQILKAEYGDYNGTYCIYVSTQESDGVGCTDYWIDVETGLLAACERYEGEDMIYRMTADAPVLTQVEDSVFQLPDGTQVSD